jgi:hypothetical protein
MTDSGGEMLLADRDDVLLPQRADPVHRRRDQPSMDRRDVEALLQRLLGNRFGGLGITAAQRLAETARQFLLAQIRGPTPSGARRSLVRKVVRGKRSRPDMDSIA